MFIKQKIGAKYIKFIAIFIILLVIMAIGFLGFRNMPSRADSEVINIGADLVLGKSGNNWSYDADSGGTFNILTITDDVTLTGEGVTDKNIRIVGNHRIKFDNMTLDTTASTALTIWDANIILLTGENTINVNNTIETFRAGLDVQCKESCLQNNIFNIDSTTGGILNINLPDSNISSSNNGFQLIEASLYIHNSTVNINIGDYTGTTFGATNGLVFGSGSGRMLTVKVEKSSLNVEIGATEGMNYGIQTFGVIMANGGYISSIAGDSNSSTSKAIYSWYDSAVSTTPSTSGYTWTASENSNGDPLVNGEYPNAAYDVTKNYQYVTLTHKAANQPVGATTITSPVSTFYETAQVNTKTASIIGTIVDADDDSWDIDVAFTADEYDIPSSWTNCKTDTTEREFTCSYPQLYTDGYWYLHVRVSDGKTSYTNIINMIIDTVAPPTPQIEFPYDYAEGTWTNSDVSALVLDDSCFDCTSVLYTINNGDEVTTASFPYYIDMPANQVSVLKAYSVDAAGNKSSIPVTATIKIDKTAPTLSRDKNGGALVDDIIYTVSPTITLAGTDSLSGVKEIQYSWHEGMKNDSSGCTYSTIADGDSVDTQIPSTYGFHSLCSRSVDNAGNMSQAALDIFALTDLRKVLIDPDTGISVETFGPEFMWHNKLVVNKKEDYTYNFNSDKELLAVFSIEICSDLWGDCQSIEYFEDALRIKIPVNLYLGDYENFTLIHVKDTGEQEEYPFEIVDGFIVFETEGLSDWAILGLLKPKDNGNNDGEDNGALGVPNTGSGTINSTVVTISILVAICSTIAVLTNIKTIKKSIK